MKRFSFLLVLLLLSAASMAQTNKKTKKPAAKTTAKSTSASVSSALLYQKWVHSFEDEKGAADVEVFRPEGYGFPPARGRKAIKFSKDGSLVRYDIAPNDGHTFLMGRWERTKFPNTMKVTIQGGQSSVYFYEVVSVGKDLLKLKRKSEI